MKKIVLLSAAICCLSFNLTNTVNYKMVTIFVYNFARNIQWPSGASSASLFRIGVWGETPFTDEAVTYMVNKKVNDQPIEVKKLTQINEVNTCQMVFVAPEKIADIKRLSAVSASSSVLLVSLLDSYTEGIGINLFLDNQDNKMKFQINEKVVKNKHIKVSKALMDLSYHGN